VYQNYALFPHLNVAQNVAFGLEMRRLPAEEIRERVTRALALVRLERFEHRRIRELSGGQQQRVALARALVIRPAVLLLDEPLSNLDAKLREEMRAEIREIQRELGMTTLFVTHDQAEALTMADRVAVMHQGRLEQVGTPVEIYERPSSRFVATFIGRANLIPGTVVDADSHTAGVRIENGPVVSVPRAPAGARSVVLMVRPHRIRLAPPTSGPEWRGRIRRTTFLGDVIQYEVTAGTVALTVEAPNSGQAGAPRVGDEIAIHWRSQDVLVFDAMESPTEVTP
jgi:putative spermidine/putrescine transport system ATP-binding protein